MRLSISSSNDRLPTGRWVVLWLLIIVFFVGFISFFEIKMRARGWVPSFSDSRDLWSYHRKRASELGSNALILVGASRIQLGIDLDEIRNNTDLEPIQLAIDGTSPVPVMENLARDPQVNGIIILSLDEGQIKPDYSGEKSNEWVKFYDDYFNSGKFMEPFRFVNNKVKMLISERFITKMEGARPFTVIYSYIFDPSPSANYLVLHKDRSRSADYEKVVMPHFYAERVARHFGNQLVKGETTFRIFFETYSHAIENIQPADNSEFLSGIDLLLKDVQQIENRGGRVIFVRLPTDKLIWETDRKKYPREYFWNELAKRHDKTIHFMDYQSLQKYNLPDGSHLDYRDKKSFTRELMKIIDTDYFKE